MKPLLLNGLDGANPLGFLAALGVLNVLEDGAADGERPALAWTYQGAWRPLVSLGDQALTIESLAERVVADLGTWKKEPAIELEYDGVRDLKPPPPVFREYLERLVSKAGPDRRRSIDFAAAFATDVAVDNGGNTKPTALHFTAGQQKFLKMVRVLRDEANVEDVIEAVRGPWRYLRTLPVLKWDATVSREHALRADAPGDEDPSGVPGADWLAFRGLSFLRVVPRGRQIQTTGCVGNSKAAVFCWPLWLAPLGRDSVQSVLTYPGLARMAEPERRARGIAVVHEASIRRSDKGYGGFAPASVV